jgi:hypothetical protein
MNPKTEFRLLILQALQELDLPESLLRSELKPLKGQGYRLDYAIPELRLGFEYEGIFANRKGGSGKSRHLTVKGYSQDCLKYSQISAILGWRLVRCTPINVSEGSAGQIIRAALRSALSDDFCKPWDNLPDVFRREQCARMLERAKNERLSDEKENP